MNSFSRWLELVRPYRLRISTAIVLSLAAGSGFLLVPLWIKSTLEAAIAGRGIFLTAVDWALLAAISIGTGGLMYCCWYLMFDVADRVTVDVRRHYVDSLLRFPISFHRDHQPGELMERLSSCTADIEQLFKYGVIAAAGLTIVFLGAIVMLFVLSWKLAAATFVTIPLFGLLYRFLFGRIRSSIAGAQESSSGIGASIHDMLLNIDTVKAFNAESRESIRLKRREDETHAVQKRATFYAAMVDPVVASVMIWTLLIVLTYGSHLLVSRELTPDALIAFLLYATLLIPQSRLFSQVYLWCQQANSALLRLEEIRRQPVEADLPHARPLSLPIKGLVEFRNVSYSYAGRGTALNGVSLRVAARESVGIVGASGAGKSTLFNLLLRFHEPQQGTILIDGVDIRHATLSSVRNATAIVAQDTFLFDDTVLENVRYGRPDATDAEVCDACRSAQAEQFIAELPRKYHTLVGGRGLKLSGGQRQRIAIARALLKNAPILLLDEATSSLDARTEQEMQQAFASVMQDRTTLVIAHRLSTVINLSRIAVIEKGTLLDEGGHGELMERCDHYRMLVAHQLLVDEKAAAATAGIR